MYHSAFGGYSPVYSENFVTSELTSCLYVQTTRASQREAKKNASKKFFLLVMGFAHAQPADTDSPYTY